MLGASVVGATVPAAGIVYTLTSLPADGTLLLNGQALASGGTFTQDDLNNGRLTYRATEEGGDSFSFSVASTNALGTTGTFQVAASDATLSATGGFTYSATKGSNGSSQAVATFTDTGGPEALTDYAATINWGDGTSATAGTLSLDPNTHLFTVTGAHGYSQDGTFDITVTLRHETAPTITATSTASIAAAAAPVLTLVRDTPASATEGSSATLTSSMLQSADSDASVSASSIIYTISTAPTLGTLADDGIPLATGDTFSQQDINDGIVTYQSTEEGADSFAFSVAAGAASPISGTFSINASDPAVTGTGGFTYSATEGSTATGQMLATFTDPAGPEAVGDYSAQIDWGDGTSTTAGAISLDPNTHIFTVTGQHGYAQDGTYAIQVVLQHEAAPAATVLSTAQIAKASGGPGIAATAVPVAGNERSPLTGVSVATFTDGDDSMAPLKRWPRRW